METGLLWLLPFARAHEALLGEALAPKDRERWFTGLPLVSSGVTLLRDRPGILSAADLAFLLAVSLRDAPAAP